MNAEAINGARFSARKFGQGLMFSQPAGLNSRPGTSNEENDSAEGEGKVKVKLMSLWNNMKYGWAVKKKLSFSKDSSVFLLGKEYMKTDEPLNDEGTERRSIEDFKLDFFSRLWMTYRREIPVINGSNFTTDCGWGCMLRSGQMMLAQALVCHLLGRDWRWMPGAVDSALHNQEERNHRNIIRWFGDSAKNSPFSIQALVQLGEGTGKKAGDWYGPASVAHLLRMAVDNAQQVETALENVCAYVAQDGAVYLEDIRDKCQTIELNPEDGSERVSWKALVVLVPVRLGAEKLNSIYGSCITDLLKLRHSIGIIGGRPRHSLYFVGFQDDKLIHLDPHYCQERVDVWQAEFPLDSFHCRSPRKMNLAKMDPSCCLGFYCKPDQEDFEAFVQSVQKYLAPPTKSEYPIFVFCQGRSKDALYLPPSLYPVDEEPSSQQDSDFDLECEEFVILPNTWTDRPVF